MSTRKVPALSNQILDEATQWFIEFDEGPVDHAARETFVDWLRTSPEHVRAYLQISARWEEAVALQRIGVESIDELVALARSDNNVVALSTLDTSTPTSMPSAATTLGPSPARSSARMSRAIRPVPLAFAASLLLAVAAALIWFQVSRNTYRTDVGEQRTVRLADGSVVELNSRSKIRVSYRASERDVELVQGQALFRVAKNPARPFIVRSGDTHVRAVGTQFDVYKKSGGTVVTVVEGRVAILAGDQSPGPGQTVSPSHPSTPQFPPLAQLEHPPAIFLDAGEQLTVTKAAIEKPSHPDIAAATAWTQMQIVFQSTPLTEVVEEFNRYNAKQIVITDRAIENIRISGVFSSADPDSLLRGLRSLGAFTVHEGAEQIEIAAP